MYTCGTFVIITLQLINLPHASSAQVRIPTMTEEQCLQKLQEYCNLSVSKLNGSTCQCKDCSCSLDCGERMNCCFEEMDTVKRAENEGLVCTKTTVGVNSASNLKGLYMISSCPKKNDTDCGSEHVAAWGSLAPFYSPERERVYKNKHCAQCHYVEDAVEMKPSFICRASTARTYIAVEEVLLAIETRFEEQSFCSVSFTLPEEAMNVSRRNLQCFPETERKCQPFEFSDPGDIDNMCRNGPLVPISYRVGSRYLWFGNAFCAYCNGIKFVEYCYHPSFEYTLMENSQLAPMRSADSFIMFLSNNEVLTSEKLSDSQKYVRSVCATKTEHTTCRPVFCPVLQRRQPDGTCGPSVVDVIGQDYEINLNFTLTPGMEKRLFRKLCEKVDKKNKRFPANFRSPWARFWEVKNEVYYHIDKGMVVYFVTSLTRRNRGLALHKILENTANTMRTQWKIDGDEETNVGQDFSSYSTFRLGESDTPGNLTFIPFALEDVSNPEETIFGGFLNNHQFSMWVRYKEYVPLFQINIQITRFSLCEQIELFTDEVYQFENGQLLYDNTTGKLLFSDEFSTKYDLEERKSFRICLEDSVYSSISSTTCRPYNLCKMGFVLSLSTFIYIL